MVALAEKSDGRPRLRIGWGRADSYYRHRPAHADRPGGHASRVPETICDDQCDEKAYP